MRRVHRIGGLIVLLLALSVGYLATKLTYFTSLGPGPGFFPFWLAVILAILAVAMILAATHEDGALPENFFADGSGYLKSATAVLAMFATAALIDRLGFVVTMVFFYAVLLTVFGRRNLLETALLTIVGSFGVYYLFVHLLGAPLPRGVYGF